MFATQIVITDRPYEYRVTAPAQATSHKAHMPHNHTVVVSRVSFPSKLIRVFSVYYFNTIINSRVPLSQYFSDVLEGTLQVRRHSAEGR